MQRLPDFIGMGVIKCGTTWTFKQLQHHPQVCASIKEVHFFDWEHFTLKQYKKIFGGCHRNNLSGEWTPEYFTTPGVPSKIKKIIPDVKLLCLLRNPVERAWSNYKAAIYKGNIPKNISFLKAFFGNFPHTTKTDATLKSRGLYHRHLDRWFTHFPQEQIKIMLFDDLVAEPLHFVQDLYKWLRIDASFSPPDIYVRPTLKYNKQQLVLTEYARKEVLNFYKPSIDKLEKKLGLQLSRWKV